MLMSRKIVNYDICLLSIMDEAFMKIYDFNGKKNLCGEKIRQARIAKKLTQNELAAQLQCFGITIERDSISRIESGTRFVADYELKIISQVLDISVDDLIGGNEYMDYA